MKRISFLLAAILMSGAAAFPQNLPDSFIYKIEPVKDVQTIQLALSNYAIKYDSDNGLPFQALTIYVQPTVGKFLLYFFNVQPEYQFDAQTAAFAKLKLDNEELRIAPVYKAHKFKSGKLVVESVAIQLSEEQFEKTLKAKNILISYGEISYQLDQANLDSFAYARRLLPHDIAYVEGTYGETDTAPPSSGSPPGSPSRTYLRGPRGGCYYMSGKSKVYVSSSYCR